MGNCVSVFTAKTMCVGQQSRQLPAKAATKRETGRLLYFSPHFRGRPLLHFFAAFAQHPPRSPQATSHFGHIPRHKHPLAWNIKAASIPACRRPVCAIFPCGPARLGPPASPSRPAARSSNRFSLSHARSTAFSRAGGLEVNGREKRLAPKKISPTTTPFFHHRRPLLRAPANSSGSKSANSPHIEISP